MNEVELMAAVEFYFPIFVIYREWKRQRCLSCGRSDRGNSVKLVISDCIPQPGRSYKMDKVINGESCQDVWEEFSKWMETVDLQPLGCEKDRDFQNRVAQARQNVVANSADQGVNE